VPRFKKNKLEKSQSIPLHFKPYFNN